MIVRKLFLFISVAAMGLLIGAFAVGELRGPARTSVEPIELDSGNDEVEQRDRPRKPSKPKAPKTPDAEPTLVPREEDPGAEPAPAPPAPAGDDDDDDGSESDDDDDDDDDGGDDDD